MTARQTYMLDICFPLRDAKMKQSEDENKSEQFTSGLD